MSVPKLHTPLGELNGDSEARPRLSAKSVKSRGFSTKDPGREMSEPVPYERPRITRALIGQALLIFPVVTLIVVGFLGIAP